VILAAARSSGNGGPHHITYQSLRAAAETDCPVCVYIWDTLSTDTKDKLHALPHGPGSPCTSFTGRSQSSVGGSVSRSTTTINADSRLNMPHIKVEIKAARICTYIPRINNTIELR
jgi:hypothetical protein